MPDVPYPPLPWSILYEGSFVYIQDANRKKIATIYGNRETKEAVAKMILEKFGPPE